MALLLGATVSSAFAQLPPARRTLTATPLKQGAVAGAIVLSVRGAAPGARYRYVAAMSATTTSVKTGAQCGQTQHIGSGVNVTWRPVAGTYRLTAYGPLDKLQTDTLSLTYTVPARQVMLASAQMPAQNDSVWLLLRTDDLGPGHVYEWWMQYRGEPVPIGNGRYGNAPLSSPWMAQTTSATATYPKAIRRPTSIRATVRIHRGDPCAIVAAGSTPANQ
jgi:hypothetical protein